MLSSWELDLRRTLLRSIDAARTCWGPSWTPSRAAVAPGRIEILGNHVDYNGGPVLAAAIDRATVVLSDDSGKPEFLFADFPNVPAIRLELADSERQRSDYGSPRSHDFALGVLDRASSKERETALGRTVVATSIPIGSGMSSSAALCVALTLVLNRNPPGGAELVFDAQAAENWTGVPCGTMDQAASVFGQVIRYEGPEGTVSIAPDLGDHCFVVVDSRVERTLGTSSYPVRVRECAEAVEVFQRQLGRRLVNLAAVSPDDLLRLEGSDSLVIAPRLMARTRHVVTEIARVGAGERAMQAQDWATFGELMNASGASSASDYEISHPRVESLVAAMRGVAGVTGARMMGGGEGGAALALLRIDALDNLRSALVAHFNDESPRTAVVPLAFAPGARLLQTMDIERLAQYPIS